MTATAHDVAAAVTGVRERIAAACERSGRDPGDVRIVAVTKGFGVDAVEAALASGVDDIAENRVQEAGAKYEVVGERARWHLIGHLQSNKVARAAELFDAVHSIDTAGLGEALGRHRAYERDPVAGLIQVDYTGSPTRSGVGEDDAVEITRALAGVGGIHLIGLMTIAPQGDPAAARACFARLRRLAATVEQKTGWAMPELSMGMSDDFEIAVEEGATMVRLGRVLFGER